MILRSPKLTEYELRPAQRVVSNTRSKLLTVGQVPGRRTEYFKEYIKAHKHARRQRLIEMLGGKCVRCGTTEGLEFDHIDPSTKRFSVCVGLTRAWAELVTEAEKCQLLCRPDHLIKTAEDRGEPPHGRYRYVYWQCRCDVCRGANAQASARQRARKRQEAKS
jgi:5-methylcytosine-specific restriction endonuclease McrA